MSTFVKSTMFYFLSRAHSPFGAIAVHGTAQAIRAKPHPNLVNVRFAHIMGFCSEEEEYFCFEDFVTGKNLEELVAEGKGELYDGTPAEVI